MAKNTNSKKNIGRIRLNIDTYIAGNPTGTFNYRQVAAALGINSPAEQKHVAMYLADLAFDGLLIETAPGKYRLPQRSTKASGTFVRRSNGKNSVIIDETNDEIFVAERNSMHALNGDKVEVTIAARIKGAEPEAEVIDITERKDQTFIGTLKVDKHFAYLLTDSKFLATDIYIPKTRLRGGKTGDKAVVRITDWPDDAKNPQGEVIDVLGIAGENDTEINAIMAEFGLPYRYPESVEKAADKIEPGITDEVIAQREDLRGVTTFTIDPRDAKDFDDALSIRRLPNGNYEVGVHIADVTHYVHPDTIIDREAKDRATSIYLVDRVVPMLPEHLCNGICSLRPDEDKLTFSVLFDMTPEGKVLGHRICRSVIRSDRRFTYEEAQERIETGKGDFADEILTLDKMAKALRKSRFDSGSVEFDRVEVRFDIDEKGHPTAVFFKESKDANKLIEEFMLLANKVVATTIGVAPKGKKSKAFVYRVHDTPDPDKLSNLADLARVFGYKLRTKGAAKDINRSLNKMLADIKGKGEENLLATLAIRSMAKAIYTTTNIGHYGLGFGYYTHFTSPIRRYPDMMVHRLLARYLAGGRSVNLQKLEDECKHSSDMEQLAANAERASIKYKQVEYMADRLGEVYTGVISGVTEWGLYVELDENKCEGLVPIRDLADDYYDFDDRNYCLVGRAHNHRYRLGDHITVQIARADIQKKQLDLALVDEKNPPRSISDLKKQKAPKPTYEKVGNRKKKRSSRRR
ncbi:MAG: ribonuclease R [Muribaculaceae bacterium]|nr:ribonuclease R [Muribaculaceae bacterium]